MGHEVIQLGPDCLEVRYQGEIPYGERRDALREVSRVIGEQVRAPCRILLNFADARPVEEDNAHRLDFMATLVAAPHLDRCRIAVAGLSPSYASALMLACHVRSLIIRAFDDRAEALVWLGSDEAASGKREANQDAPL